MKKSGTTYRTTNLDLACLLVALGHVCKTRKIGLVSAEFTFADPHGDVDDAARKFYQGDSKVNPTTFMYARFSLKRELAMKAVEWEKARPGMVVLQPGQFYYFINTDGKAYKNVYANREPHIERVMKGNAFLTMNEAQAAVANTKID